MKSRLPRLLIAAGVATLFTAACNVDAQQAGQAAERVMTVAAQITPAALETTMASSAAADVPPVGALAAAGPTEAPLVYARCITRRAAALSQLPQAGAAQNAPLSSRSIITAYGRTADGAWVLGWDAGEVHGWLPAAIIGCTAPVEDLRLTDAGWLLTPTAAVVAEATPEATAAATSEATSEATLTPPATVMINAVTATPEATLEPAATEAPAKAATAASPTRAPAPATATPKPANTALPLVTLPAPARVITVVVVVTATPPRSSVLVPGPEERASGEAQVRDLRCEVTPGTPVNLRNGPARTAKLLDSLPAGTRFLAQGRNDDAGWLYGFTERQMPGWLIASSVECDGDPARLVEVDR